MRMTITSIALLIGVVTASVLALARDKDEDKHSCNERSCSEHPHNDHYGSDFNFQYRHYHGDGRYHNHRFDHGHHHQYYDRYDQKGK